jgi:DNA polymerase epsilon subunit 1
MDYDMEDAFGAGGGGFAKEAGAKQGKPEDAILDIREYDVPYYLRVAIDKSELPLSSSFPLAKPILNSFAFCVRTDIRVGLWYEVSPSQEGGEIVFRRLEERVARAEPVVLAFDIETTKAPLKFPDQLTDQVMMISYMIDGQVSDSPLV